MNYIHLERNIFLLSIMVNHSIEKYLISHSNKQSTQSMSQEELLSFINLGKSTLL